MAAEEAVGAGMLVVIQTNADSAWLQFSRVLKKK